VLEDNKNSYLYKFVIVFSSAKGLSRNFIQCNFGFTESKGYLPGTLVTKFCWQLPTTSIKYFQMWNMQVLDMSSLLFIPFMYFVRRH